MKKNYSILQNAHLRVSDENGEPKNWVFHNPSVDIDNAKNDQIAESYAHYIVGRYCGHINTMSVTDCVSNPPTSFRVLNGQNTNGKIWYIMYTGSSVYYYTYQYNLSSGATLALLFAQNCQGGSFWPLIHKKIRILYILDVNGNNKPNQIGRDIYYFMLNNDQNSIVPYYDGESDCKKDGYGFSCAYDIISNGWNFPKDYPY